MSVIPPDLRTTSHMTSSLTERPSFILGFGSTSNRSHGDLPSFEFLLSKPSRMGRRTWRQRITPVEGQHAWPASKQSDSDHVTSARWSTRTQRFLPTYSIVLGRHPSF